MPLNTDISVVEPAEFADSTAQLLQPSQPLSLSIRDCLSMSTTNRQVWIFDGVESLAGLAGANLLTIEAKCQQCIEQLYKILQPPYSTDENTQNNWVAALLLQLVVMHIYLETAAEGHPDQFVVPPAKQWEKHATYVMTTLKGAYVFQLSQLVYEGIQKKTIESKVDFTVDSALLKIHQHALTFYFQQLKDRLSNTAQDCLSPDEEDRVFKPYIDMIRISSVYISELSTLKPTEKECLPNLLLVQLTQLIKDTSTLDLSPSWMECLKQWIEECFSKLQSLYKATSSTEKTSSALRTISQRLRKSAKKVARNKNLQSPAPESIRKRCWLYFSLHEQLITEWWDKEKHALEYQSTALALFESFMSTFDWPSTFKKGILRENPLRSFGWFTRFKEGVLHGNPLKSYRSTKQTASIEQWEPLLEPALDKLSDDFFIKDWFGCHSYPKKGSFLYWLVSRHEFRLMAKIKAYASAEERDFQEDEIAYFDKRNLYRFVQETYEDFCADLNQITQMILSVWLQEIGRNIPHADLANILLQPGCWLYHKNQSPVGQEENAISKLPVYLFDAIEHLGAGVYFFPPFQKLWSAFQEALAVHSGSAAEFVHKHYDNKIAPIFIKLLHMVHPDRVFEFKSNWTSDSVKNLAQSYMPRIQSIKDDLRKLRERDPSELQSSDAEIEAEFLLKRLKEVVLDYMRCHLRSEGWVVNALTLSPDALQQQYSQEICEYVSEVKQIDANISKARVGEKEARKRREEICKNREVMLAEKDDEIKRLRAEIAENKRLRALLAERGEPTTAQTAIAGESIQKRKLETNSIHENPKSIEAKAQINEQSFAESRGTLFHVPTTSQASIPAAENPAIAKYP